MAKSQTHKLNARHIYPPEWIEPIAKAVDRDDDFADVPLEARGLIRQSAIMARAAKDARLKKRTLTNLYNERPTWLKLLHAELDRAVLAAYAMTDSKVGPTGEGIGGSTREGNADSTGECIAGSDGDWSKDWADVWTDTGAGFPLPANHALSERRKEIDQKVPANLLRMNLEKAG